MKKLIFTLVSLASAVLIIFSTFSLSHSRSQKLVPSARSGGPASGPDGGQSCTACHSSYSSSFAKTGWITSDIPGNAYVPGATYNITVTVNSKGYKHGFETSCQTATACVGTFISNDSTQVLYAGTNSWITHLDSITAMQRVPQIVPCQKGFYGTHHNQNSHSWTFQWTAPTAGTGTVTIYSAMVAANGNGSDNLAAYPQTSWKGDSVFTSSLALTENTTANFSSIVKPCGSSSNGSATVNATFGTGPYTYLWTPSAQTTSNATGLAAGNYTVSVHDALSASMNLHLTLQNGVSAIINDQNTPSCPGAIATHAVLALGGTTPYTYLWSGGGQTTSSVTGLIPGTYSVTITDAAACSTIYTFNATDKQAFLTYCNNWQDSNLTCKDGNNGYAKIQTRNNITGSLAYSWNSGQTTQTVTNLAAGTYTCTVVNTGTVTGCTTTVTTTSTVTITEPAAALTASITAQNNGCNNANNGTATASGFGGTAPYSYAWSNGSTTFPVQTTPTATGLAPGNYSCTVTCYGTYVTSQDVPPLQRATSKVGSCYSIATVTITNPTALTSTVTSTNASCNISNGTASVSASGGAGSYTYFWSNSHTTASITGLNANSYGVIVTDANGCTSAGVANVINNGAPTATVTPTNALCHGGNGSATVAASGGTGAFSYVWSSGSSTSAANNLASGNYTVTVTDASSCSTTTTVTITQPTAVTASASVTANVSCNGGNDGSAAVTAGGGTPTYNYAWSNGSPNPSAGQLTVGGYTVTITDANGCTKIASVTITQPIVLTATMSSTDQTVASPANGTATANPSGGSGAYLYAWSTTPVQTTSTATDLDDGTYSVTVTDAHGCTLTNTVVVLSTVGINTIDLENSVSVFPNPNLGEFNITLNASVSNNYVIEVRNLLGQVMYNETLTNFSGNYIKHLDVKTYGGGIYFLNIRSNENQVVRKVVVN